MAQLPAQNLRPVSLKLQFHQPQNHWTAALEIPYDAFPRYSSKPRAWLDYLGHAITGSDGILSLSPESTNGTDACGLDLAVSPGEVYYFHTNGPLAFIDPRISTTVSSHPSSFLDSDFGRALIQRDGKCVFTNTDDCEAAHLLGFMKGDEASHYTIKAWGPLGSAELLRAIADDTYYPEGYYKRKEAQDKQRDDRREARERRRQLHDTEFDAMDLIAMLWGMHNGPALERAERAAEAEAKQRSAEKVTEWLNGH
ncbi:hypothetical protein WOLCODRAFT_152708 [Wolfiporia cocos MD-104 SS10]|uniref:HNH nuclease domain-containing protein n=1 Tax=Wolfiporia cocos (strain MD-104) TaxID=742152 RepID=A0A2H3JKF7_WOLCO|nr:hypothetical protein WOLCODRAFT_152708 [Wolfiporia cocos MD-104 SS10]